MNSNGDVVDSVVYRLDPATQLLRKVAGLSALADSDYGAPPDDAALKALDLAVGADGSVYIADTGNRKIKRVGTDGVINTIAGASGANGCSVGSGTLAELELAYPNQIESGPNGVLYIADAACGQVLSVTPDGRVEVVADSSSTGGMVSSLATDPNGNLFLATRRRLYMRSQGGLPVPLAGGGSASFVEGLAAPGLDLDGGEGGPSLATSPDGSLVAGLLNRNKILRVAMPSPDVSAGQYVVPDEGGQQLFVFDDQGRHLQTLHALTNAVLYSFDYDKQGHLATVKDKSGNVTTIERDKDGAPSAIVSPYGEKTTLSVDSNGFLSSVRNIRRCPPADPSLHVRLVNRPPVDGRRSGPVGPDHRSHTAR